MFTGINVCMVEGFLGKAPIERITPSGHKQCLFSIAAHERYESQGQMIEVTHWINIKCLGKLGEAAAKYLSVGSKVLVQGALSVRQYTKEDGTIGNWTEITADKIRFMDRKPAAQPEPDNQLAQKAAPLPRNAKVVATKGKAAPKPAAKAPVSQPSQDDIPF